MSPKSVDRLSGGSAALLQYCDTGLLGSATIRARNTLEQRRIVTRRRWNLRRLMSGRPCGHESRIGRDVRWSRRTRKAYRPIVGAREFLVIFFLRHDQASAVVPRFSVEVCEVMVVVDVKWLKSPKVAHCRSSTARADHPSVHRLCCQVVSAKRGKSWEW
jgi:hypothetical protein